HPLRGRPQCCTARQFNFDAQLAALPAAVPTLGNVLVGLRVGERHRAELALPFRSSLPFGGTERVGDDLLLYGITGSAGDGRAIREFSAPAPTPGAWQACSTALWL